MFTVNDKTNVMESSRLPDAPRPGMVIPYFRDGRRQWGIMLGTETYEVKRHTIRGQKAIVERYFVEPCSDSNVVWVSVPEEDIDWKALR